MDRGEYSQEVRRKKSIMIPMKEDLGKETDYLDNSEAKEVVFIRKLISSEIVL